MAAEWWELAIPTAGTLLGAAVGAGSQLWARRHQTRHEREMAMFDRKREAYADFGVLAGELARLEQKRNKYRQSGELNADRAKEYHDELTSIQPTLVGSYGVIRMIGSKKVRTAAGNLVGAAMQGAAEEKMDRLHRAFESAAQKDLGTEPD